MQRASGWFLYVPALKLDSFTCSCLTCKQFTALFYAWPSIQAELSASFPPQSCIPASPTSCVSQYPPRNTLLWKTASSWHAPPKSGINREYYSSPGPHKILYKDMGSSKLVHKEPVSRAAAKNYACQHFQGDENPPDDQSSTPGRGQGTNLRGKVNDLSASAPCAGDVCSQHHSLALWLSLVHCFPKPGTADTA